MYLIESDLVKFRQRLLRWYDRNQRDLPWRQTSDPYCIWVSEVMLQQTRVSTVIPYYHKFLKAFPDPKALAAADLNDVLKVWEGLGYYARARNLQRAANIIVDEYHGCLPADQKQFRALPGVGEYISSAVLSIAFRLPFAVVDGNVKRVLSRLLLISDPVNSGRSQTIFTSCAGRLLHRRKPHLFNQALMELGAMVCRPYRPGCTDCPVRTFCRAFIKNQVGRFPRRIPSAKVPVHHVAAGVVYRKGRFLITHRKPDGLLGGLWEFPGGKIIEGETPPQACQREIREEVNLNVEVVSHLTTVKHAYTHFKIIMDVFICQYVSGRIRLNGPDDFCWINTSQLSAYPFPKATLKALSHLCE
jgi:A/G-specific adenine glycosylase